MANIMLVDDSPIILQRLRAILEELGHRIVVEANDGREAVERYDEHKVDLVTMDIQMPGMNGIEAVRQIKARNPNAVILMVSSVEERSKVFEAIKMGAKHYIVKPFSEQKVKEVISAVLGPSVIEQGATLPETKVQSSPDAEDLKYAAVKKGTSELDIPDLASLPFELFHMDDRIVLIIRRHIHDSNVQLLHTCLQGLLYFRKKKIVLEFWEPIQHDVGMSLLQQFVAAVREQKGTIGLVTENPTFYHLMQSKLRHGVYRTYKEIQW